MFNLFKRISEHFIKLNGGIRRKIGVHKLVVPGLGITVLIIVAGWLHLRKDTEDTANLTIVDLDKIVAKRMLKQYRAKYGRLTSVFRRAHLLRLDWSGVECISFETNCIKHEENVQPRKNVLLDRIKENCDNKIDKISHKVIYTNNSSTEQVQKIERVSQLSTSEKFSMSSGICHTMSSGISIGTANETIKASINTSDGMNLNSESGKFKETKETKLKANNIRIPKNSTITVLTYNKPKHERYTFETWVTFQGEVTGIFYNMLRRKVSTIKIPMDKTLLEDFPTDMIDKECDVFKVKHLEMYEIQYEIEQTTVLETNPKTVNLFVMHTN